jgi:HEAT repeat protein
MVAALEDADERIRWIAGSALLSRKDECVSTMLTTFIKQTQSSAARASAQDWLRRIGNQP